MNILFLSLSFSTSKHKSFYEDLLYEFQKRGNKVYVACANERSSEERDGLYEKDGMSILRIRIGNITGNIGVIEKGISTIMIDSLFLKAIRKVYYDVKFDLIIYPTPPITLVNTITKIKKRTGAKTYLLLKDIFPQNAVDLALMQKHGLKGLIYKYFRRKEKKLYAISDYIGCMSPANVEYVLKHNPEVKRDIVEVCPNCIALPEVKPVFQKKGITDLRVKYNIPEDVKIFIYGGNLGKPQGIKFLVDCLDKEKNNEKVFFVIVGSGTEYSRIEDFIKKSQTGNTLLLKYLPKEEYKLLVNQCQIGMIFLDYRFQIPNFPSRLLSYMAAGMPVIVATDPNTDMGSIVEENGFGYKCLSNDVDGFSQAVNKIINSNIEEMGKNAWEYLVKNYTVSTAYNIIIRHLSK